jgi:hypothetical protein
MTSSQLEKETTSGTFSLSGDSAKSAELGFLLASSFGVEELMVHEAQVSATAERMEVSGLVNVLGIEDTQLTLAIAYGGPTLRLSLNRATAFEMAPDLGLRPVELTLFKETDGPWGSSGSIAVALVDTAFRLIVAYEEEGDDKRFRFRQQLDSPPVPVTLPGVGSLALSAMELRRAQSNPTDVRWQILADAALGLTAIPSLAITLYGTSTVPPDDAEAGIAFEAFSDDARNRISQQIAVAGLEPLPRIDFTPRLGLISRQGNDWTVAAAALTEFFDFPPFMSEPIAGTQGTISLLPAEPREWTLRFTRQNASLSIDRLWNAGGIRAVLPDLDRPGQAPLPLGQLWIDAIDWSIVIGEDTSLGCTVEFSATPEANRVFGVRADGLTPSLDAFRTFPAGQDQPSQEQKFGVALSVAPPATTPKRRPSPIQQIAFDAPWWTLTLGNAVEGENYGKLRFQSPTFSYGGGSFSATGAYEVVEQLRLPLTPIKSALAGAGLAAAADALPDAVPVVEIDLVDEHNQLNAAGLMALLEQTGLSDELRDGLASAIAAADQFLARTPPAASTTSSPPRCPSGSTGTSRSHRAACASM